MNASSVSRMIPALCVGLSLLAGSAASAWAYSLCVPVSRARAPQWWADDDPVPTHAPFKQGAVASTNADGKVAVASMLWEPDTSQILVRVQLWGATSLNPEADRFVLALSEDGAMPSLFVQFRPLLDCADAEACGGTGNALSVDAIEYSEASGITSLTWSTLSSTNPSTSFSIEHPWVAVEEDDSGPVTTYDWTLSFALEVPVDGAGEIVDNLAMFGSVIELEPGLTSDTHVELPVLCESSSVVSDTCLLYASAGLPELPLDLPTNVADDWTSLSSSCGALELAP